MEKNSLSFLIRKNLLFFVIVFFFSNSSSFALEAEIICPEKVFSLSEFDCEVKIFGVNNTLDLKLEIKAESLLNQLFIDGNWRRADWYYKEFTEKDVEKKIKTRLYKNFSGNASVKFALRTTNNQKIIFNKTFFINIEEPVNQNSLEEKYENKEFFSDKEINNLEVKKLSNKIDLNKASFEELLLIKGIGEKIAREIIKIRPLCSIEDLKKIKGIGEKNFQNIISQDIVFLTNSTECFSKNLEGGNAKISNEENKLLVSEKERIINLDSDEKLTKTKKLSGKLVYESKNEKIRRYSIYFFAFLLVLIIFFILKSNAK